MLNEHLSKKIEKSLTNAKRYLEILLSTPPILLGMASPPKKNGVYAFSLDGEIIYVGEALGLKGLRDRILSKHVSGDESHAFQKALQIDFPDRGARRAHMKSTLHVQWVEIPDSLAVSTVEKLAIEVLEPRVNKAVQNRRVN
jgi:hypothetical protein